MKQYKFFNFIFLVFSFSILIFSSTLRAEFIRNDNLNVVLDTSTNLIWEDDNYENNNKFTDWQGGIDYCNSLDFAEINSWVLPTIDVLRTLISNSQNIYGKYSFYIDNVFKYMPIYDGYGYGIFLSSSPYIYDTHIWYVIFSNGNGDGEGRKSNNAYVRCVSNNDKNFTISSFPYLTTLNDTTNPIGTLNGVKASYMKGDIINYSLSANDENYLAKVTFSIADSNNNEVYKDTQDTNGTSFTKSNSFDTSTLSSGTYWYALWVKDSFGNTVEAVVNSFDIIENSSPTLTISSSTTKSFINESISFTSTATDSDGTISNYLWNFGDGSNSTEANPIHTYTTTGTYDVNCTVTDDKGATTTKSINITINNIVCLESEKLINGSCIAKTCKDDGYNCPSCNQYETLKYGSDSSGYCELSSCPTGKKLVNGSCIDKTCKDDSYNCPSCNQYETLKYSSDGSGYCELSSCSNNQKLVDGSCVDKTCKDDNYNCPYCSYNETLKYNSDGSGVCKSTNTSPTSLDSSKQVIYFNDKASETAREIEVFGGVAPYIWSSTQGSFEYINSDKSIAIYIPNEIINKDDTITIKDSSTTPQKIVIDAKYVSELKITPNTRYIVREEETTFNVVGGLAPFNAIIVDGDGDVIDSNRSDEKVIIKSSKIASTLKVEFSDMAGQKVIKDVNVVDKLRVSPENAYFDSFEGNLTMKISGGVTPYTAITTAGDVETIEDMAIYKPANRYESQEVTIRDSSNQEAIVKIFVEGGLRVTPSNPSLNIGESVTLKAIKGSGDYSWSAKSGTLSSYSGESITYTAPNFPTEDIITLSDSSGSESVAIINIEESDTKTLTLKEGWNLVSLLIDGINLSYIPEGFMPPIGTEDISILGDFEVIYSYEGAIWSIYKKSEEKLFKLKPQMGFWIKMNSKEVITFDGENYVADLSKLNSGWNLVGTGKRLTNIKESFGLKEIWSYKNSVWSDNPNTISAGEGFWVKK